MGVLFLWEICMEIDYDKTIEKYKAIIKNYEDDIKVAENYIKVNAKKP